MNNNKLLIFIITLVFLLSVNFAFAADENSTDLTGGRSAESRID